MLWFIKTKTTISCVFQETFGITIFEIIVNNDFCLETSKSAPWRLGEFEILTLCCLIKYTKENYTDLQIKML